MFVNFKNIFELFQINDINDLILKFDDIKNCNIKLVDRTTFLIDANNNIVDDTMEINPSRGVRLVSLKNMLITDQTNNIRFSILNTTRSNVEQTIFLYVPPDGNLVNNRYVKLATIEKFPPKYRQ